MQDVRYRWKDGMDREFPQRYEHSAGNSGSHQLAEFGPDGRPVSSGVGRSVLMTAKPMMDDAKITRVYRLPPRENRT